ncbi:hypothetical protein [Halovulum sp. GXIMD14793]
MSNQSLVISELLASPYMGPAAVGDVVLTINREDASAHHARLKENQDDNFAEIALPHAYTYLCRSETSGDEYQITTPAPAPKITTT